MRMFSLILYLCKLCVLSSSRSSHSSAHDHQCHLVTNDDWTMYDWIMYDWTMYITHRLGCLLVIVLSIERPSPISKKIIDSSILSVHRYSIVRWHHHIPSHDHTKSHEVGWPSSSSINPNFFDSLLLNYSTNLGCLAAQPAPFLSPVPHFFFLLFFCAMCTFLEVGFTPQKYFSTLLWIPSLVLTVAFTWDSFWLPIFSSTIAAYGLTSWDSAPEFFTKDLGVLLRALLCPTVVGFVSVIVSPESTWIFCLVDIR